MKNKAYDLYELPAIRDLRDMLEQKRKQIPDTPAFCYGRGKKTFVRTYKEFYEDVCCLGTWLMAQKGRGKKIAVIGENSYEWLLSFFAIVCSGNVAVPIDKELSGNGIGERLSDADVDAVIYGKTYGGKIAEARNGMTLLSMEEMQMMLDAGNDRIKAGDRSFLDYRIDPKECCCIMFTSGTSGKSKGVMLSHENIAGDINGSCKLFVLEGNTIAILPFHHAFGLVVAVFMVLNYGYTIYINSNLRRLQKDLVAAVPQTMFLVPLFVETFHKQIWASARKEGREDTLKRWMRISDFLLKMRIDVRKTVFRSVRSVFGGNIEYIICGGAALDRRYVKEFRSFGIEILNGYGTTECSPCAAVNRNYYHRDGTVGQILPGVEVKISEQGEVLLKGSIVMQGYYNDPAATSEVIREGWYHTGDLGTVDADGFLTLAGRCKNLILLSNGENVSPEEVEEVLVYEENGVIVAEIYPQEAYRSGTEILEEAQKHFDALCREINRDRPRYKQVGKVCLRSIPFPKNTSQKIIR